MTLMLYERYQQPLLAETQNNIVIDGLIQPHYHSSHAEVHSLFTPLSPLPPSISTSVYIDPHMLRTSTRIVITSYRDCCFS